jgi:hypothetical protein
MNLDLKTTTLSIYCGIEKLISARRIQRRQRDENVTEINIQDARLSRNFKRCKRSQDLAITRVTPTQAVS